MIRTDVGFSLYANMTVIYNGRASSTAGPGNFLLIHKPDGSTFIHASGLSTPLNYQRPGSTILVNDDIITVTSKDASESIKVILHDVKEYNEFLDWSKAKPVMKGTEKQLCDKIIANIDTLLGIKIIEVNRELKTPIGDVDIVGIDAYGIWHIIEVKRGRITTNDLYQLWKYYTHLRITKICNGYMAAPAISVKAQGMLDDFGFSYLMVDH